jgi:hypothetical protein
MRQLQRLILDVDAHVAPRKANYLALTAASLLGVLIVGAIAFMTCMPAKPDFVESASVLLPDQPWVSLTISRFAPKKRQWVSVGEGTVFNKTDRIYVGVKVFEPCHVYLLERSSTSNTAQLAYPAGDGKDKQLEPGSKLTYPEHYQQSPDGRHIEVGGITFNGPAATEMLIAIASHDKLDFSDGAVPNQAFQSAITLLDRGDLAQGIEVSASSLSPSLGSSQSLVYLERLPISHAD